MIDTKELRELADWLERDVADQCDVNDATNVRSAADELDRLRSDNEMLAREGDRHRQLLDEAHRELDRLRSDLSTLEAERDAATKAYDAKCIDYSAMRTERGTIKAERDAAVSERGEPIVWANQDPFTGAQVLALLNENESLRKARHLPPEVAELKRPYEATTKGKWHKNSWFSGRGHYIELRIDEKPNGVLACDLYEKDAAFIAAAHNLMPRILELIEG